MSYFNVSKKPFGLHRHIDSLCFSSSSASLKYELQSLNKTESAVFYYCRFSLFLKNPDFFPDYSAEKSKFLK